MVRLEVWASRQEAASTVFPDPAWPLSRVNGERCTARESSPSRRGRGTVACARLGGASFAASSPTGPPSAGTAGAAASATASMGTLVIEHPLVEPQASADPRELLLDRLPVRPQAASRPHPKPVR